MRGRSIVLGLCALILSGCPNTDAAVFVEPTIASPAAQVSGGALGVSLKGSFTLKLHLGARASDASQVSITQFKILDENGMGAIVDPLPVSSKTMFPVTVEQDSDVDVDITFDTGTKPLPSDVEAKLCAGNVTIGGAIDDSLQDRSTPVLSAPFKPTGCP